MFLKAVAAFAAVLSVTPSPLVNAQTPSTWGDLISDEATISTGTQNSTIVPKTYIVQLKSTEAGVGLGRRNLQSHEEFHRLSKKAELAYTTRQTFADPALFLGLSLTLDNANDLQTLKDLDNVLEVWPVVTIPRPLAAISVSGAPPRGVKTRAVVPGTNVTMPYIVGNTHVNNPHAMTKIDQAHALGIKGKGMKIAIIDTGVDFQHPSLGGCFGPGCKIGFGYDYITPKEDPGVTCLGGGHGTHVSGIIGMEDLPGEGFGLIGVAPEATLGMYRVFDCSGTAETDVIISALLQAAADGAHVVSMSLGLDLPSEISDPFRNVTTALAEQGIGVVAAAGNDGQYGPYNPSAPGTGASVFSVGSTDNSKFPTTYKLKDSNGRSLRYSSVLPLDGPTEGLTVQVLNYGGESVPTQGCYTGQYTDALANLTAMGIDPATVILAVKNGGCNNVLKGRQAKLNGYNNLLVYTTPELDPTLQVYEDVYPGLNYNITPVQTSIEDSKTILGSYAKHPFDYKIYFDGSDYAAESPPVAAGGLMSNYSSFGPLFDLNLKPQLSAPGAQILATWPLGINSGYAVISGTSMATPLMAGAYALIKSQKPDMSVKEIYALMQNSAGAQLPWIYNSSILSSTVHQGAGSLDIMQALTWESLVTPPQLNLGFSNTTVTTNFTITNRSSRSKTYTFSHKPAGGMSYPWDFAWERYQQWAWYATVTFETESILIKGGESATVKAFVTPPPPVGWRATLWPVYTGFLVAKNNYETYTIPYVGSPFVNPYA